MNRYLNDAICEVQRAATARYGDGATAAEITRRFTSAAEAAMASAPSALQARIRLGELRLQWLAELNK